EFQGMRNGKSRYVSQQWEHKPQWHTYGASDARWFGLEARRLHLENRAEALLIPLFGHTLGHCGVAIPDQGGKWLLHGGDSYRRRRELGDRNSPWPQLPLNLPRTTNCACRCKHSS